MRKGAIAMLVLIGVVAAAITTAVAIFIDWLPDVASVERERIDLVFWVTTWICVGIFAIVAAVIVYAVWKFRAAPDDDSDGAPIHGHTGLEIAWTAVPTVLVVAIGILSGIVLAQNERAGSNPMKVEVLAQQFTWSFTYPNGLNSTNLRLPVDRPVVLELRARDVIHSFWVREFGQKQDAVPGIRTTLVITPNREGEYTVICTELCGLGHAVMRQRAIVMPQGEFDRWLAAEGKKLEGPAGEAGAAVFESQGCGSCHAFEPAGSTGTQGPSLDQLAASAEEAGKPLDEFTRESILAPDAYVHPGFSDELMPENYGELPDDQIDALVEYLTKGAGKQS